MKTLDDFPIGSLWKSKVYDARFEVIDHKDGHIVLQCTHTEDSKLIKVGQSFSRQPYEMDWVVKVEQTQTHTTTSECHCSAQRLFGLGHLDSCPCKPKPRKYSYR